MKYIALFFVILLFSVPVYGQVKLGTSVENTDFGEISDISEKKYNINFNILVSEFIKGEVSVKNIFNNIIDNMLYELKTNIKFIKKILVLCILNGLILAFAGDIKPDIYNIAHFAVFTSISGMLITALKDCGDLLIENTSQINELIKASVPIIIGLTTVSGTGGLAYGGILALGTGILNSFIENIIIPQISFMVVLAVINKLGKRDMVGRLSELIGFAVKWQLRICAMLFLGALTLVRLSNGSVATAANKGIKLAVGAVPIVGDIFQNSLESVTQLAFAIKGGACAALVVLLIVAMSGGLIKLVAVMLMYRLTSAVTEPLDNSNLCDMVDSTAEGISLIIGAYFTVALMFVGTVIITLGSLA